METRSPLPPKERKEHRFAEKPRRLRSLRGLAQREVARMAGIDGPAIRHCELARRMPEPEHVRNLAAALKVTIPFGDTANRNEPSPHGSRASRLLQLRARLQRRFRPHRAYEGLLHPGHRMMDEGVRSDAQKRRGVPRRLRAAEE